MSKNQIFKTIGFQIVFTLVLMIVFGIFGIVNTTSWFVLFIISIFSWVIPVRKFTKDNVKEQKKSW